MNTLGESCISEPTNRLLLNDIHKTERDLRHALVLDVVVLQKYYWQLWEIMHTWRLPGRPPWDLSGSGRCSREGTRSKFQ